MKSIDKISNAKKKKFSSAFTAGFWFTICNVLQRGIQFLATPIYTRILSTEEYGMYSLFATWLNIFTVVATLSLSNTPYYNGMLKYEGKGNQYTSSIQSLGSLSTILCAVIFTIIYPLVGDIIGLPYEIFILMFAIIIVNLAFQFWSMQQRLKYRYKALVFTTLALSLIIQVGCIIFALFLNLGYKGIVYGYVVGNLAICSIFYFRNYIIGRKLYVKEYWSHAISLSVPLIPHYLAQLILAQSDRIMINYYLGAGKAGIYSLSYQISLIMTLLTNGINSSLTPWMYRCLKESDYKKIKDVTGKLIILVSVLSAFVMLIAPEIVVILGTVEYLDAVWIMPPVVFCTCYMFVYGIWGTVLFFYEKNVVVAVGSCVGAVINVLLNALLIPRFGFIAAAYTTVAGYVVIYLLYYRFSKKVCSENGIQFNELFDMKLSLLVILALIFMMIFSLSLYKYNACIRYMLIIIILFILVFKRKSFFKLIIHLK